MEKFKLGKIIRIITLPPVMALLFLSILYAIRPEIFGGTINYILAILYLTILPLLGYPLQPLIPRFKNKGREGQRQLAIIMAVLGYVLGIISAICMKVPKHLLLIYLTYLFSGLLILLFNKVIKIRASGHACGVAGPITMLIYSLDIGAVASIVVLILVYWVSLKTERHTWSELIWGTVIPVFAFLGSLLITNFL